MTLAPKLPPGRANRKALQFTADIHRLRSSGYTFSAIRTALLEAGVSVGLTTIKREAARPGPGATHEQRQSVTQQPPSTTVPTTARPEVPMPSARVPTSPSGREIAEAFFAAHPSNPLFQTKENS
ncbi:hypothetical protein [Ideonella sp. A 288]|uniref:hypothetical protein n=1 Tax=Ideonella sp. A 288 TaxID=1962181 RepID=UPI000B4BF6D9|nr:hypothetical protein [Ideonella sp. A 288]